MLTTNCPLAIDTAHSSPRRPLIFTIGKADSASGTTAHSSKTSKCQTAIRHCKGRCRHSSRSSGGSLMATSTMAKLIVWNENEEEVKTNKSKRGMYSVNKYFLFIHIILRKSETIAFLTS